MQRFGQRVLAWTAMIAAVLLLGLGRAALADPNDITVGGVWVCKITHGASGATAAERVVQVRQRIGNVLSTPRFRGGNAYVYVRAAGTDGVITVGDQQGEILVFTVTPEDAAGTSLTPVQLAGQWAPRLAAGLSKALPSAKFHIF